MKTLIIHIGMHKTGSSSIQATLYHSLEGTAFQYVDLGVDNPTGPLRDIFTTVSNLYKMYQDAGSRIRLDALLARRERLRDRFREQLAGAASDTLILSAEGLLCLSEAELSEFRDFIAPHAENILCVAYVRSPKGFMDSIFQQRIKGRLSRMNVQGMYPEYRERFEKFERIFGKEKIRYWKFDPKAFPEGCVVRDFCRRLDIPLSADKIKRINEGLSRGAVAFLYTYRRFGGNFPERLNFNDENVLLVQKMSELSGQKIRFAAAVIRPVLEKQAEDIRWMEERLGTSLTENDIDEAGGIRSEKDLFQYDAASLQWLAAQLGPQYECRRAGDLPPHEVAQWVHLLRMKLAGENITLQRREHPPQPGDRRVYEFSAETMVSKARLELPDLISLHEAQATALVYGAFSQIAQDVRKTEEGIVRVNDFGQFRIQQQTGKQAGKETREKRVIFTPLRRKVQGEA